MGFELDDKLCDDRKTGIKTAGRNKVALFGSRMHMFGRFKIQPNPTQTYT